MQRKAAVIDGTRAAAAVKTGLTGRVASLAARGHRPGLGTILVGSDAGSHSYVAGKHRDCAEVGIESLKIELPADVSGAEVLTAVEELNADPRCSGFIVQLPLPEHVNTHEIWLS